MSSAWIIFFILFPWQFIKRNACCIYCVFGIYTASAVMADENTILQFRAADTKETPLPLPRDTSAPVCPFCRYIDALEWSLIIKRDNLLARAQLLLFAKLNKLWDKHRNMQRQSSTCSVRPDSFGSNHSWRRADLFATLGNNSDFFCGVWWKKKNQNLVFAAIGSHLILLGRSEKCKWQQIQLGWILISCSTKVIGFLTRIGT